AHPPCDRVQQQGHEEHSLTVVEMGNRKNGYARLARAGSEECANVERVALAPDFEARRCDQRVYRHRQRESILGWKERVDVHHADLRERRMLDALDQRCKIETLTRLPRR